MRRLSLLVRAASSAAIACALLAARPAAAQFPNGVEVFRRFGRMSSMNEPTLSNLLPLLTRSDVQRELGLDIKQKQAIEDLQNKSFTNMATKMMQGFKDFQNLSPEEREAQKDQLQAKAKQAIGEFVGELDKDTEALLKPEQMKRLRQLDLQWRGPMAMGDPKVAAAVMLEPDQQAKVNEVIADYHTQQQKLFQAGFAGLRPQGGDPADSNGGPPPAPPSQEDVRLKFAEIDKQVNKMRTAQGAKVLDLLTDDERTAWNGLLGKKFYFSRFDPTDSN